MDTFNLVKTKVEWQALVTEHAASGLSQVAFCQKKNISPGKFGYYRSIFLPTKKI